MNPLSALLFVAAIVSSAYGYCYDAQVAVDQDFNASFVCNYTIPYPKEVIESDLQHLHNIDVHYFLDTSTTCFDETGYFSKSHTAAGDYLYECVCPSPRKLIEKVWVKDDVCFVVRPEQQNIQYAECGGHCSFDYTTKIATASRGYFCVPQSFVQREFLVWCPYLKINGGAPVSGSGHGHDRVLRSVVTPHGGAQHEPYQPFGYFQRMTRKLPSLCSCRGYFCDNHALA